MIDRSLDMDGHIELSQLPGPHSLHRLQAAWPGRVTETVLHSVLAQNGEGMGEPASQGGRRNE